MEKIIVYVDDAAYALAQLQPMLLTDGRTEWRLVACAPHLTRHASKWVSRSAREDWRGQWSEGVFNALVPALRARGDSVQTQVADGPLHALTHRLRLAHGPSRVMDARRPKFGHLLPTVTADQSVAARSPWQLPLALAGVGAMLVMVGE